jgi:hypothetical protein
MARSNGLDLQVAIAGHLKNSGFRIQEEEEWDHNNKIDFVITKFPKYPKLVSVGVQITGRCNDGAKLSEFMAKNDPKSGNVTVAERALYLEIEEGIDINKGGADLVASVLYAYQFDEQFADARVWAARIQSKTDAIRYKFYDPKRSVIAEQAVPGPVFKNSGMPVSDIKDSAERLARALGKGKLELEGKLHTFLTEKGFGFISAQDGSTYYMHVNDVKDDALLGNLDGLMKLPGKTPLQYQVIFEDGGKTRADATYKTARNVRLLLKA